MMAPFVPGVPFGLDAPSKPDDDAIRALCRILPPREVIAFAIAARWRPEPLARLMADALDDRFAIPTVGEGDRALIAHEREQLYHALAVEGRRVAGNLGRGQ